jgi:hypothetical protein
VTHESAGFVTLKVKEKSGYSGSLTFDGDKVGFAGKFTASGNVTATVSRTKFSKDPVQVSMVLDWSGSNELITGSLSNGVWTSDLTADKAVFGDLSADTTNAGNYTLNIPTDVGAPAGSPGGVGYGTVTNSATGIIKFGGLLGDGEKLSQKVNISRAGNWPMYVPLYKNSLKVLKGSMMGWVKFNGASVGPTGSVSWIKKNGSESLTYYADGFSNQVGLITSPYVPPALDALPITVDPGDYIIVSDGNLTAPMTNTVVSVTGLKVLLTATNTMGELNKAVIGFKGKDGTFAGKFLNGLVPIKTLGAVLQNTTNASGFFLGTSQSGTITLQKN